MADLDIKQEATLCPSVLELCWVMTTPGQSEVRHVSSLLLSPVRSQATVKMPSQTISLIVHSSPGQHVTIGKCGDVWTQVFIDNAGFIPQLSGYMTLPPGSPQTLLWL